MKCDAFESLCRKEAKVLFHAKIPFNRENYFKKREVFIIMFNYKTFQIIIQNGYLSSG